MDRTVVLMILLLYTLPQITQTQVYEYVHILYNTVYLS